MNTCTYIHISLEHAFDMHGALYVRVQLHFIQIPFVDAHAILLRWWPMQSRFDLVKKKKVTLLQHIFFPCPCCFSLYLSTDRRYLIRVVVACTTDHLLDVLIN
jgi:hypothetical protein